MWNLCRQAALQGLLFSAGCHCRLESLQSLTAAHKDIGDKRLQHFLSLTLPFESTLELHRRPPDAKGLCVCRLGRLTCARGGDTWRPLCADEGARTAEQPCAGPDRSGRQSWRHLAGWHQVSPTVPLGGSLVPSTFWHTVNWMSSLFRRLRIQALRLLLLKILIFSYNGPTQRPVPEMPVGGSEHGLCGFEDGASVQFVVKPWST